MMPKLIPFPAMMVKRKLVAMLRCPMSTWVTPNVHETPTPMVSSMATSVRSRR